MDFLIVLGTKEAQSLSRHFDAHAQGPFGSRFFRVESVSRKKAGATPAEAFEKAVAVIICPNIGNYNYFKSAYSPQSITQGPVENFDVVYQGNGPEVL